MSNSRFAMAIHLMTSLAFEKADVQSSKELASSLNTNPVVVRRLLVDLQKAGLLQTLAGRTGGARLAKPTSSITLYDIYKAVDDGELFAFNPNDPNESCALSCEMKSVLEPIFESARRALDENLRKTKLSEVLARLAKKCPRK